MLTTRKGNYNEGGREESRLAVVRRVDLAAGSDQLGRPGCISIPLEELVWVGFCGLRARAGFFPTIRLAWLGQMVILDGSRGGPDRLA